MDEGSPRLRAGRHCDRRADAARASRARTGLPSGRCCSPCSLMVLAAATADASERRHRRPGSEPAADEPAADDRPASARASCGSAWRAADVKVLNGIVTSKAYARATSGSATSSRARPRPRCASSSDAGTCRRPASSTASTAKTLTRSMERAGATWYGPGFYGNRTACGRVLRHGHGRRRPPDASLRHQGHLRLPRPLSGRPGDRPRPLQRRLQLRPHQRRRARRSASTTRTRSATPSPGRLHGHRPDVQGADRTPKSAAERSRLTARRDRLLAALALRSPAWPRRPTRARRRRRRRATTVVLGKTPVAARRLLPGDPRAARSAA